jgi:hypothetical protein
VDDTTKFEAAVLVLCVRLLLLCWCVSPTCVWHCVFVFGVRVSEIEQVLVGVLALDSSL